MVAIEAALEVVAEVVVIEVGIIRFKFYLIFNLFYFKLGSKEVEEVLVRLVDEVHLAGEVHHAAAAAVEVVREERELKKSPSNPIDMRAYLLHVVKKTIYS